METRDWDAWNKDQNKLWEDLVNADKEAKSKGELVGRYFTEGVADGNAYYQVVKVTKTKAHLKHVPLWDAYAVAMIEAMDGKVPLKYVLSGIQFRDNLARAFAKKG